MTPTGRLFILSAVPLAAACGGLFWFFVLRLDLQAERWMADRAQLVAALTSKAVAPGLDFEDVQDVTSHLAGLSVSPDVRYAVVLRKDGRILAGFGADAPEQLQRTRDETEFRWEPETLHVVAPVNATSGKSGTLAFGLSLRDLHAERRTTLLVVGAVVGLVLAAGGIVSYLIAYYIARRRAAEQAHRCSEERFERLIETLPDALLIESGGRVAYANPAAVNYLGFPDAGALLGFATADLFAVGGPEGHSLKLKRLEIFGEPQAFPEVALARRDGALLTAEVLAVPHVFDSAPASVLILRDLTERKRIQAQLVQADRMASVGTLAAGVAHEINNPMAYVTTNLNFALGELDRRPGPGSEDLRQALGEAQEGAERVMHIVASLRTYSRADDEGVVAVDAERALDAAVSIARAKIRARGELVRRRGEVPPVAGQESRLVQVFVNLLTNAAQALPKGDPRRQRIEVSTEVWPGDRVAISVKDTGSGISPENLPRLFDPFFTTKPVGEGTGLGLSICHGIVMSLGGEIQVESQVGVGSTFRVLLRTLPGEPAVRRRTTLSPAQTTTGPLPRMLVVDDEPRISQSMARLFAREFCVVPETSARQALERLRSGEDFDIVVCDLMMPDMTGIELFGEIRRLSPRLARRVVFLTGGAVSPENEAFFEGLTNPVVEKPFDGDRLRELLLSVLKQTGSQRAQGPAQGPAS